MILAKNVMREGRLFDARYLKVYVVYLALVNIDSANIIGGELTDVPFPLDHFVPMA